jgi:HAD superfamily hydrolase (TIGR01509 family)
MASKIMSVKPKAIIFDLGNVLVTVDNSLSTPRFAPHLQEEIDLKELENILYGFTKHTGWGKKGDETKLYEDYHAGNITTTEFTNEINKLLKFHPSMTPELFQQLWPDRFTRKEKSIELLKRLKAYKRYMLSDTNEMDIELEKKLHPDIFAEFDDLFFSHQTRKDKYSYDAWKNVIRKSGLRPEEHLFIDDKADHVQRAKDLGIQGIVFESPEQLETELQKLGML